MPLAWSFQQKVWFYCAQIPCGRVSSYGAIARAMGFERGGAQAVGNALHHNPFAPIIPCHRVIKADASIGGYRFGLQQKRQRLKQEQLMIVADKVSQPPWFMDFIAITE